MFKEDNICETFTYLKEQNRLNNITGIFIYHDGHFMQVIEGEKKGILDLYYKNIIPDNRHYAPKLLLQERIPHRHFNEFYLKTPTIDEVSSLTTGNRNNLMESIIDYYRKTGDYYLEDFWK